MITMNIAQTGQYIQYKDTEKFRCLLERALNEGSLKEDESIFVGHTTDDGGRYSIYLNTYKSPARFYFARVSVENCSGNVAEVALCSD